MGAAILPAQGNGARFLNFEAPGPPIHVLYVDGEMMTRDIRQRARDICRTAKLDPGDKLHIWTPDAQPEGATPLNLFTEEGREALENHIADLEDSIGDRIELVSFDNLRTLFPGWEENKAESFMPIAVWTIRLRSQHRSVALFHHSNKAGGYSGNTAIVTTVHSIVKVEQPEDYRADMGACFDVAYEYTRARPDGLENFNARLEGDLWTVESRGEVADELVRILLGQGMKPTAIGEQIGKDRNFVNRAIARLKRAGKLEAA